MDVLGYSQRSRFPHLPRIWNSEAQCRLQVRKLTKIAGFRPSDFRGHMWTPVRQVCVKPGQVQRNPKMRRAGSGRILGSGPAELDDLWRYSVYRLRPSHRPQMSSASSITGFHPQNCKSPFTRYNLLSIRLSNRFDNRLNVFVQPGWTNSGCSFNTVVKPVWQPVWQPVGCLFTRYSRFYSRLSVRLYNRIDNRLYSVNGA